MESSGLVGDCVSPESTVTSLLSSSGYLRSSLLAPERNTSFTYRDKNYDSASAALDAYITDFERSRQSSVSLTGSQLLPQTPPFTPTRPRVSMLRNRDVLRERLTDRELDFLNLPVSSLHHQGNRDRLSMTTDELLAIPYDGSMPVTHTSAFIQGVLSQSGASRARDSLSSSLLYPRLTRTPSRSRERAEAAMLNPDVDFPSASCYRQSTHRESSQHLPHWLTSNRTDMDCSGISSLPDLKYPAWIQRCDVSEPLPATESELWDEHAVCPRRGAPSWVAELEEPAQVDGQQTLTDLRLQFAEQVSLLAAERNTSEVMKDVFRDRRIECLIQKADQVLNSLAQSSSEPVNTEELLPSSSSHCPPRTRGPAAGGATQALTARGAQVLGSGLHGNGMLEQPGPVEALKQMLFRLQAVEAELQRQRQAPALSAELQQRPEGEAELEAFAGGPSLQRAMLHLSRLKVLVEEPRDKQKEDEDEGRYSSSSTDGLLCSQQKPD